MIPSLVACSAGFGGEQAVDTQGNPRTLFILDHLREQALRQIGFRGQLTSTSSVSVHASHPGHCFRFNGLVVLNIFKERIYRDTIIYEEPNIFEEMVNEYRVNLSTFLWKIPMA
ncbi:hypothetical protein ACFL1G_05815 [Planctomycetota bacterium]